MKNKYIHVVAALVTASVLFAGCCMSESKAPPCRNLKVLAIGNSFSVCLLKQLPACAKAAGCNLDFCSASIGGCSLQRHWGNVVTAAVDAAAAPYSVDWAYASVADGKDAPVAKALGGRHRANLPAILTADRWDVVTIQQASHFSAFEDSYEPYAGNLVAKIRELAPQARIMIQQTWAYCNADGRIYDAAKGAPGGTWGFDQDGMYARLTANYRKLGERYGLDIIPSGYAVQLYRKRLPVAFTPPTPERRAAFVRPEVPSMGGEVVGSYHWGRHWRKPKDPVALQVDSIHLNREGHYLQACTWLAKLYDVDIENLPYAPDFGADFAARAPLMRRCAADAVREGAR